MKHGITGKAETWYNRFLLKEIGVPLPWSEAVEYMASGEVGGADAPRPGDLADDVEAFSDPSAGKVDIRLAGKGNSSSRGARPVYSFRGLGGLGPVGCQ